MQYQSVKLLSEPQLSLDYKGFPVNNKINKWKGKEQSA